MKTILLSAALLGSAAGMAQAQDAAKPAPATPASAQPAPAATATLNADTQIETLMAKPEAKVLLLKYVPEIENHPAYEQFKTMSVRQLQPLAGGLITDEKISALEAELTNVK